MATSDKSPSSKKRSGSNSNKPAQSAIAASFQPKDLIRMFAEWWWIGLILAVPSTVAVVLLEPEPETVYETRSKLLFEERKTKALPIEGLVDTSVSSASQLNTQLEQIRSSTFYEYLTNSFAPEEIERIQKPYKDPKNPTSQPPGLGSIILPNTNIYPSKGSPILVISVTNRDPEMAALIANRYARKYIDFNLDSAMTETNSTIILLRNQAEEAKREVEEAERNLQAYREKHNMAALGESQNIVLKKVGEFGEELVTKEKELLGFKAFMDSIDEYQRSGKDLFEISYIKSYGSINGLRNEIERLKSERKILEERYLEEHPKMKQNSLSTADAQQRLQRDVDLAIASLRSNHELAIDNVRRIKLELDSTENQARSLDKISIDYKFLTEQAAIKRSTHIKISDRLSEASLAAQMENVNIKIFERAFIPSSPVGGAQGKLTAKASIIFLLLLIAGPIGAGLTDTRIKSTHDIEEKLGVHLLGGVKTMTGVAESNRSTVFTKSIDDSLSEAYRGLYSEIEIRSTIPSPKVILITSTIPHEGKSTTAANLAAVFAAHGKRTVIVDCDLRRPSLHRMFGLPNDRGALVWFKTHETSELSRAHDDELGVREIAQNLFLLTSGGAIKNPTEVIERLVASALLEKLRTDYDIVIIDTPPAGIFPDALLLARECSEIIYVTKFRAVRRGVVKKILGKLTETNAVLLGVILNSLPKSPVLNYSYEGYGSYTKEYYRAYDGTESKEKEAKKAAKAAKATETKKA